MRDQPRLLSLVVPGSRPRQAAVEGQQRSLIPGRLAQSSWRRSGHPNCRVFVVLGPDGQEHTRGHGLIWTGPDAGTRNYRSESWAAVFLGVNVPGLRPGPRHLGSSPLVSTTLRPTRTRQGFSVHPVSRATAPYPWFAVTTCFR